MHRATVGHAVQLFALGVGEHALEGQFDLQCVFAFLLLAVVAFDLDRDAGQRDFLLLCVKLEGQCLARPQRRIELIVGLWRGAFAAEGFGHVGEKLMVVDLDAVTKTFAGFGIDGNGHDKPHKQ